MSVFKKLKDVLFDVEEEEIPVITKEEKRPVREELKREINPIKEVKMPKEEVIPTRSSNFNFPLDYPYTYMKQKFYFQTTIIIL